MSKFQSNRKQALLNVAMALLIMIGTCMAAMAQCSANCPSPINVNTGHGTAQCYLTGVTCQQGCVNCTCTYGNCGVSGPVSPTNIP
jgi:hypothetical protein